MGKVGRPRKSETAKKKDLENKLKDSMTKSKTCENCKTDLVLKNYYNSNSVFSSDGKVNICKNCLKNMIDCDRIETIYKVLQLLDVPFFYKYWQSAVENNPEDPWSTYIRMANSKLNKFRNSRWKDSIFEPEIITPIELNMKKVMSETPDFVVTKDIITRWGDKYDLNDYIQLENFYNNMKRDNKIETAQEESYLKKLAVISLKLDKALEEEEFEKINKLGNLFSKYMADSQFRAMDKTEADKTGGIRTFSQIFTEVEKDGFIPPWEHYREIKGLTQDIVDETIMHIENFTLRLNKVATMSEPPRDTPKINKDLDNDLGDGNG